MLKLTPQQVVLLTGLTEQTLRHWRVALPPLQGLNGHRPCFEPGDAMALLVLGHLVKNMGFTIASLTDIAIPLFHICRTTHWSELATHYLLVDTESGNIFTISGAFELPTKPMLLLPMRQFFDHLQKAWGNWQLPVSQLSLNLESTLLDNSKAKVPA